MGLELQLEDVILLDAVGLGRGADHVAQQRETGQGKIVLEEPQSPALSEAARPQRSPNPLAPLYHTAQGLVGLLRENGRRSGLYVLRSLQ